MSDSKVIKTMDFEITTREEVWTRIYTEAMEAGFSEEQAKWQTDRAVNQIFDQIGPEMELELREKHEDSRLRPKVYLQSLKKLN